VSLLSSCVLFPEDVACLDWRWPCVHKGIMATAVSGRCAQGWFGASAKELSFHFFFIARVARQVPHPLLSLSAVKQGHLCSLPPKLLSVLLGHICFECTGQDPAPRGSSLHAGTESAISSFLGIQFVDREIVHVCSQILLTHPRKACRHCCVLT
jgi:hypothetical protein